MRKAHFAAKKNLRLLTTGGLADPAARGLSWRQVAGGFLVQDRDNGARDGRRPQGRDEAGADGGGNGGPAVRLDRGQAREVERHRLCEGRARPWASGRGR